MRLKIRASCLHSITFFISCQQICHEFPKSWHEVVHWRSRLFQVIQAPPPPKKKNTFLASTILTVDYKKSVD